MITYTGRDPARRTFHEIRYFMFRRLASLAVITLVGLGLFSAPAHATSGIKDAAGVLGGPMTACAWSYKGTLSTFTTRFNGSCGSTPVKVAMTYPRGTCEQLNGRVAGKKAKLCYRVGASGGMNAKFTGSLGGKKITAGRFTHNTGHQECNLSSSGPRPCTNQLTFKHRGARYNCSLTAQYRYLSQGDPEAYQEFVGGQFTKNGQRLSKNSAVYALCAAAIVTRTGDWNHYSIH